MELWFIWSVVAAVSAGLASFVHKVMAEHQLNVAVVHLYSSVISTVPLGVAFMVFEDTQTVFTVAALMAALGAFLYFGTVLLKVAALRQMDTTIFYPLYKLAGPLIAIMLGIVWFGESFTVYEWVGLTLGMTVPLLLITREEHQRQNNLVRGVIIMILAAATGTVSIALYKYGIEIGGGAWMIAFVAAFSSALIAYGALMQRTGIAVRAYMRQETNRLLIVSSVWLGLIEVVGIVAPVLAFAAGGTIGAVYTILSIYILIPIVLSIIFYNEHWNARKVVAIVLSIAALGFLR